MSDKFYIGDNITSFEDIKTEKPVSKVTLMYDDQNGFSAGDDSGLEIVATCYFATQAMADNMLAVLSGYKYHAFTAGAADLDPAAELGDGITVGGAYGIFAQFTDDGYGYPDVSAPGEAELEEEFPHPGFLSQDVKNKVQLGRSYFGTRISRTNGLEIVKTEADGTEKSRAVLNSDVQAFYNDDGQEALYFDINAGKFRFRGDVEITGGTMNVNDNFIVDEQGNLTLNGDINLSNGKITWGSNAPVKSQFSPDGVTDWSDTQRSTDKYRRDWDYSTDAWGLAYKYVGTDGKDGSDGDPAAYLNSIQITEITKDGVKAAKIESGELWGGEVYGGKFSDLTDTSYLKMSTSDTDIGNSAMLTHMYPTFSGTMPLMGMGYVEAAGDFMWALMVQGGFIISRRSDGTIKAYGTWDFSGATVTGL